MRPPLPIRKDIPIPVRLNYRRSYARSLEFDLQDARNPTLVLLVFPAPLS